MNYKIYYSCLMDSKPTFYYQTWILINSLIKLAEITPQNIFLHHTPEVDTIVLDEFRNLGIIENYITT